MHSVPCPTTKPDVILAQGQGLPALQQLDLAKTKDIGRQELESRIRIPIAQQPSSFSSIGLHHNAHTASRSPKQRRVLVAVPPSSPWMK